MKPFEERSYWRDVGSLDAYHAAQRDVRPTSRFQAFEP